MMIIPLLSVLQLYFLSIPAVPIEPSVLPCRLAGNYPHEGLTGIPPHQTDCDLTYLNLRANSIQNIPLGALEGYLILATLIVSDNQLANVEKGAFSDAKRLISVDLSHNYIQHLNQCFADTILSDVYLQHNRIQYLDSNTFSGANHIEVIDLSNNEISEINETTFFDLPMLRTINLAHNVIESLDKSLFEFNSALLRIDLQNNRLSYLHHRQFETLTNLKFLYLSNNPLSFIELRFSSSFNVLLHAGNCDLTNLPNITFSGPFSAGIIEMDLQDNMVDCNCTVVEMEVTSNRVLRCVDEVTRIKSSAICVNDITETTVSSSTSGEKDVKTVPNVNPGKNESLEGTGVHKAHHRSLAYIILVIIVVTILCAIGILLFVRRRLRRNCDG